MNEEAIKELLAMNFVRSLASFAGYITTKPDSDYGEDLLLQEVISLLFDNGWEYFTSGKLLSLQLKCTTEKSIRTSKNSLHFRLKTRNFNHMVERAKNWEVEHYAPLVLILLVLPKEKKDWLTVDGKNGGLTIGGKAYWHIPFTLEKSSKRGGYEGVEISLENQLTLDTIHPFFNQYAKRKR